MVLEADGGNVQNPEGGVMNFDHLWLFGPIAASVFPQAHKVLDFAPNFGEVAADGAEC